MPSDSGVYQCVAVNSAGEIWAAGRLQVNTSRNSPAAPTSLKCHAVSPVKILISWEPPKSLPYTSITAYTVHYSPVGESSRIRRGFGEDRRSSIFTRALLRTYTPLTCSFGNRRWQGGSFPTRTRQLHVCRSDGAPRTVYKLLVLRTRVEQLWCQRSVGDHSVFHGIKWYVSRPRKFYSP